MAVKIGSARIDENGGIAGGAAGDQTGREVATEAFYMHSQGWYVLRAKDPDTAKKLATAMKQACANDNIGYDQYGRYGVITAVKRAGSMKKIAEKTEADCSSLVRGCIYQAAGKDVGDFNTGNEADVLEKSGLFEKRKVVNTSAELYNGDVLVTKTKGHTAIVVSGKPRDNTIAKKTDETVAVDKTVTAKYSATHGPDKKIAGKYETTSALHLRQGAGIDYGVLAVMRKGLRVDNYGYYSLNSNGTKWLYIEAKIDGITYVGFASSKCLKKVQW